MSAFFKRFALLDNDACDHAEFFQEFALRLVDVVKEGITNQATLFDGEIRVMVANLDILLHGTMLEKSWALLKIRVKMACQSKAEF